MLLDDKILVELPRKLDTEHIHTILRRLNVDVDAYTEPELTPVALEDLVQRGLLTREEAMSYADLEEKLSFRGVK